jgi:hypothetical protein
LSYLVEHFLAAARDAYFRSIGNKPSRDGSAYARASSGNERYLPFQFHVFVSLSRILTSSPTGLLPISLISSQNQPHVKPCEKQNQSPK